MENQIEQLTFKNIIMSIGAIPSSYVDSMSYYETLVWLCNYLQETVIPTVNNNGQAVVELQNAYLTLHDYIEHYFDNLDVQTEINNKLDEMAEDGSLTNLIKAYVDPIYQAYETAINNEMSLFKYNVNQSLDNQDSEISSFKTSINTQVGNMQNVVNAMSATPLTATNTSEMTDTTKVYVNTTDGKWYYYNGSAWTIGGTYQSTAVGEGSITILNLDSTLQSNFNMDFSDPLENSPETGFYYLNDGTITQSSDSNYICDTIDLTINKIYVYSGYDESNQCGLIIEDSSHNIVYNSNPTPDVGITASSAIILANQNGLKAYLSVRNDNYHTADKAMFRVIENIYNNLKIKTSIDSIKTIAGCYIYYTTTISNNDIRFTNSEGYTTNVYPMSKGVTYKITYKGLSSARGYCVTNLKNQPIDIASTADAGTKTFTATQDGYIYTSNNSTYVIGTVEVIYNAVDLNINHNEISPLKGKKIIYDGDSVAESRTGASANNGGAYAKIIADNTGGTYVNQAVGGGRLSSTIGLSPARHSVVDNLTNLPTDGDLYCFEGGVNDYFNGVPLGTFDPEDYTSTPDITTVGGALEKIFQYSINNFLGKPIVFVIIHKTATPFVTHGGYDFPTLRERLIDICNKYSIPYYDAYEYSGLNGMISNQASAFLNANAEGTADGLHPNENGYKYYYVPQLTKIMESIIH